MSTKEAGATSPTIEGYDDLVQWIAAGEKPERDWRIGTEHEKFVFHTDDLRPCLTKGPAGIKALMEAMIAEFGWEAIKEGETTIALKRSNGSQTETISLEPGGQFELSGAPLATLHETCAEAGEHLARMSADRRGTWHRFSWRGLLAQLEARSDADDAEEAL